MQIAQNVVKIYDIEPFSFFLLIEVNKQLLNVALLHNSILNKNITTLTKT